MPLPAPQTPQRLTDLADAITGQRAVLWSHVDESVRDLIFPMAALQVAALTDAERRQVTIVAIIGEHATGDAAFGGVPVFLECEVWLLHDVSTAVRAAFASRRAIRDVIDRAGSAPQTV